MGHLGIGFGCGAGGRMDIPLGSDLAVRGLRDLRRGLLRCSHARRQLHNLHIPEMNLRAFGLHTQTTLLLRRRADAIPRVLDYAIHHHVISVPLAAAFAAVLNRHAALATRIARLCARTPGGLHVQPTLRCIHGASIQRRRS